MINIFKATKDEILKGCGHKIDNWSKFNSCKKDDLCSYCISKLQLLDELSKKVDDVIKEITKIVNGYSENNYINPDELKSELEKI
jgi:hypothetical protein